MTTSPTSAVFTSARGCLETEDAYGDALAGIANLVIFVDLGRATPLLHCVSWYDLRATLEQPSLPPAERVRLWQSVPLPSNYVYRVLDRWFDPMLEPLTRYYNTFLLHESYDAQIGTTYGSSTLHGATERLHRIRPIHRADVLAYVREEITADELRARLQPPLAGRATLFDPAPEDAVRPSLLYTEERMVLARAVDDRPFGHGLLWQRGHRDHSQVYDGTMTVEELPADVRAMADGDHADSAGNSDDDLGGDADHTGDSDAYAGYRTDDGDSDGSDGNDNSNSAEEDEDICVAYSFLLRVPGVQRETGLHLHDSGHELEPWRRSPSDLYPVYREMHVEYNGYGYRLRPCFVRATYDDAIHLELRANRSIVAGHERAFAALTRYIASLHAGDLAMPPAGYERVLEFADGSAVYQVRGVGGFIYGDGGVRSLRPVLMTGVFRYRTLDNQAPATTPYAELEYDRALLDENGAVTCYRYDGRQQSFRRLPEVPAILAVLLQQDGAYCQAHDRAYLVDAATRRRYLVADGGAYCLETGNLVYPVGPRRLCVWYDGLLHDYADEDDENDGELLELVPATQQRNGRRCFAPNLLSRLMDALRGDVAVTMQYAPDGPRFAVRHVSFRRFHCMVEPADATTATDTPLADTPCPLARNYIVHHEGTAYTVQLPDVLPATWDAFQRAFQARNPAVARIDSFMELLEMRYETYGHGTPTPTDYRLLVDDTHYDIAMLGPSVTLTRDGATVPPPNLARRRHETLYVERRDGTPQYVITNSRTSARCLVIPGDHSSDAAFHEIKEELLAMLNGQVP